MKKIGLIGGMSWLSSIHYYRVINEWVKDQLGGLHNAETIMYSVDFAEIERCQREGKWEEAGRMLAAAAQGLENAGADFFLICANTMHKVADQVQRAVRIPLLHIADSAAAKVKAAGIRTVGLLGTSFTLEQSFLQDRLSANGLRVIVPGKDEIPQLHRIIFEELCRDIVLNESRQTYQKTIAKLAEAGAEGIILGCTELSLLLRAEDSALPLFDTAYIHAVSAAVKALEAE